MQIIKNLGRINLKTYVDATHLINAITLFVYMLYLLILLIYKHSLLRSSCLL